MFSGGTRCAATPSLLPGAEEGEAIFPNDAEREDGEMVLGGEDPARAVAEVTARGLEVDPARRDEG